MFKSKESLRLLIFMALVLTVPAVVSHVLPAKGHFDAKPIARLRAKKPNIVILSDSMVDNGVDPELLGKLLGERRVECGTSDSRITLLHLMFTQNSFASFSAIAC